MSKNSYKYGFYHLNSRLSLSLILCITFLLGSAVNFSCNDKTQTGSGRIVIEMDISKYFFSSIQPIFKFRESVDLYYTSLNYIESTPDIKHATEKIDNGKATWVLYSDKPINISPPLGLSVIMNPGDSLHIIYLSDNPVYSGSNTPVNELLNKLMASSEKLPRTSKKFGFNARTYSEFNEWNNYSDNLLAIQIPIIDSYKDKIQEKEFHHYKTNIISEIENNRLDAFTALVDSISQGYQGFPESSINAIWDTTQCKPWRIWLQSQKEYYGRIHNYYAYNRMIVKRRFNFDSKNDSITEKDKRTYLYYTNAKNTYHGLVRERLLAYIMDEPVLKEMGAKNELSKQLLADYYNLPGYPEYKKLVKGLESNAKW